MDSRVAETLIDATELSLQDSYLLIEAALFEDAAIEVLPEKPVSTPAYFETFLSG